MKIEEFHEMAKAIDPDNAEYIVRDLKILYWQERSVECASEGKKALAADYDADIEKAIREYNEKHLTPANAMVGDGATVVFYTDRVACTIISVTPKTITLQRDRATLDPKFEPHIIPGGFCGHCINQDEQEYTYEPDPQGTKYKFHWSDKYQQYGQPDDLRAIKGRYEFYDFNF